MQYLRKIKRIFFPPVPFLEQERKALSREHARPFSVEALAPISSFQKQSVFNDHADLWASTSHEIHALLAEEDSYGGVNPGDRRAIHAMIYHLQPCNVLEFGTHIGASMLHIGHALGLLQQAYPEKQFHLTTVDILDVNLPDGPWQQLGMKQSPRAMIQQLGLENTTSFAVQDSLKFLGKTLQTFDFVFLDGNHSAVQVYREIVAALRVLNPGGFILLHDYIPNLDPIWPEDEVIPGPWLAVERLHQENPGISVLPLGELPWITKSDSRVTSLAILGRSS